MTTGCWDMYACDCTSHLWNVAPKDMTCPYCGVTVEPTRVVPAAEVERVRASLDQFCRALGTVSELGPQDRWGEALAGERVVLYDSHPTLPPNAEGTIVLYQHDGYFVWVRFDCDSAPRQMRWHEIRPAVQDP